MRGYAHGSCYGEAALFYLPWSERRGRIRGRNREFRRRRVLGTRIQNDGGGRRVKGGSVPNRVNINSTVGRHINANPLIYLPFVRRRPASTAIILSNGNGGTPSSPHPSVIRTLFVSEAYVRCTRGCVRVPRTCTYIRT